MVKFILIAAIAVLAIQGTLAKPKAKKTEEKSTLEELAANAQTIVNNVTESLGLKDLPDSKKVVEVLNTNAQSLATHVQEIVDKLKGEVKAHEGEIDGVLKSVEQKLTETANSLQQAAGPEATAKAKEIRDNLDKGLKDAVAQVNKLVKAVEPDATKAKADIEKAAKTLLDQIVEISTNVQTQVKATLEEYEKKQKN